MRGKDDAGVYAYGAYIPISNGWHAVEVEWQASSAAGANDGLTKLWIDGALVTTLSGVDNETREIDTVMLGAASGLDAGTSGAMLFDDFEARKSSYIGTLAHTPPARLAVFRAPRMRLRLAPLASVFSSSSFVYDGDGKRVKSVITTDVGVTTTYFVGSHYEVTDGVVTKYYYAGSQRIAMRKDNDALKFILGDHLGSTSVIVDANGGFVSKQMYKPWGETRSATENGVTKYQYTGQYSYQSDFGLLFYNARFYDSSLGRFTSADTIVPSSQGVQAYDRFAYTNNNPLRYTDPTGHRNCEEDGYNCSGDKNINLDIYRQDYLFSQVFNGSGDNGKWTLSDWRYYNKHRSKLYLQPESWNRGEAETVEGWDLFALHVGRLSTHYTIDQKDKFVRDFALLFGGVPTASNNDFTAMLKSAGGPPIPLLDNAGVNIGDSFLHYQNTGLSRDYFDKDGFKDNQSHHYAGAFYTAYWVGPDAGAIINFSRDVLNPGDINLGGQASIDAYFFWVTATDLNALSIDISRLSNP